MKKFTPIFLTLMVALLLCSCYPSIYENVNDVPDESLPAPQSAEELYSLYDTVSRDMTKDELTLKHGEGTPSFDDYGDLKFITYFNDTKSAGVSITFNKDGTVLSKTLYFNKKENLIPFSGRYIDEKIPLIKTDMSVESAVKEMNSTPLELSCYYLDDGPLSANKIYCWYNEDGSNFMLHTEKGTVSNVALYRD